MTDIQIARLDEYSMYVDAGDDAVGRHVLGAKAYEKHVMSAFDRYCKSGMTVLDIGANIGFFSMLAASRVGSHGRVLSIEPNPSNARMIEASRQLNNFSNIKVIQAAASTNFGMVYFETNHTNGAIRSLPSDHQEIINTLSISTIPIDSLIDKEGLHVDFIKIDVEGHERSALVGASDTIKRCRPIIITEFSPGALPINSGCTALEYAEMLSGFGYKINILHYNGEIEPCETPDDAVRVFREQYAPTTDHNDLILFPS